MIAITQPSNDGLHVYESQQWLKNIEVSSKLFGLIQTSINFTFAVWQNKITLILPTLTYGNWKFLLTK